VGRFAGIIEFAFDPGLCGAVLLPIGKQADAVTGGEDIEQAVLELVEGQVSSVRLATMPSAPRATMVPGNVSGSAARERWISSPLAATISIALTAVERHWLARPEPCVAVAQAPMTEMCGSEARFGIAKPC